MILSPLKFLTLIVVLCIPGLAASTGKVADDPLLNLSIEELMQITVVTASRQSQKLNQVPSAVFVITGEDIRRSGATSIPEALRMAPGVQVERSSTDKWAVSIRGFNGVYANKLQVLMDGRSIYNPLFAGVQWEQHDTLLEDIERIEVIRGPGATLWGSNAVNGVINITTKNAKDTQGGLLTGGGGSEERRFGGVRYGTKWGDGAYGRVYAKSFDRDGFVDASGRDAPDDWQAGQAGFRVDWQASGQDTLTVQGDIYRGDAGQITSLNSLVPPYMQTFDERVDFSGGNLLARWQRTFSPSSELALHVYYDRTEREERAVGERRDTFDFDLQHRFAFGERQDIIWGLGYRFSRDRIRNSAELGFIPDSQDVNLFSAFIQDEITLVEDRLRLMLGSKFEHNDYTGFEIQPNVRLLWTPDERHAFWAAVSRAVRTPSRVDMDFHNNLSVIPPDTPINPQPLPILLMVNGNPDLRSEEVVAYELGYRFNPIARFSLDIAGFYNVYDRLRTTGILAPPMFETTPLPPHLVLPLQFENQMHGHTYGVELAANWQPLDWWRLRSAYTYFQADLSLDAGSTDVLSLSLAEGSSPKHQFSLLSSMDLSNNLELDLWFRYVGALRDPPVDSYTTLDARLAWKPRRDFELSIVGQNMFDSPHLEFGSVFTNSVATEVERGVYVQFDWRF